MPDFRALMTEKIKKSREKHEPIHSAHEGYAVILEELDEFKAWVWMRRSQRDKSEMLKELVDIAAACQRVAEDLGLEAKPEEKK